VGVILSASYMLRMVQSIFYGRQSSLIVNRPAFDLNGREHIMLWPMAVLMLIMGVASPYWIKGIEGGVSGLANQSSGAAYMKFGVVDKGAPANAAAISAAAVSMEKQ
jgi:NADH-quinone oxidoreductase subunit M